VRQVSAIILEGKRDFQMGGVAPCVNVSKNEETIYRDKPSEQDGIGGTEFLP